MLKNLIEFNMNLPNKKYKKIHRDEILRMMNMILWKIDFWKIIKKS